MTEEKKGQLPPGQYSCKISDVQIEPGRKPGDLKAMLTVDVPGVGSMKVEAGSARGSSITEAAAKKLVQHIVQDMERESALLQPNPQVFMRDPYALLDLIRKEANLSAETIDAWMLEAQKGRRGGPSA